MHSEFRELVARALAEDIGSGDVTSHHCVPADIQAEGTFYARQLLVLAGTFLLDLIFDKVEHLRADGERVHPDTPIARTRGSARALLTRERVALNLLQRMCGVATLTRRYVDAVAGTGCQILDTRKTIPGLRKLDKIAAKAGGAVNHRMGLWDAILIKNNHIDLAGGVRAAVSAGLKSGMPVECEVRSHAELVDALDLGVTRVLLDNMTPIEARHEIEFIAGRASVEISGGVTLETVRAYAETGANFISIGALTHSAPAADLNFRIQRI